MKSATLSLVALGLILINACGTAEFNKQASQKKNVTALVQMRPR
ncbi:MAG: hypothetical protein RIR26_2975 [Pseudomonadota bacterium]